MKTFKEQLNFVIENGCSVGNICIAASASACFNFDYTDEEFEQLCQAMQHAWFAGSEVTEDELACAVNEWINSGGTVEEICEMSKWDLLNAAFNGWDDINVEEEDEGSI